MFNVAPSPGGYVGWVCTAGGTPGTWTEFGLIEGPAIEDCADVIYYGYRLDGDFDGNCGVTVDDLAVLVSMWLADCGLADCSAVDTDNSSTVNLVDFAEYCDNFGQCNEPGGAGCIINW